MKPSSFTPQMKALPLGSRALLCGLNVWRVPPPGWTFSERVKWLPCLPVCENVPVCLWVSSPTGDSSWREKFSPPALGFCLLTKLLKRHANNDSSVIGQRRQVPKPLQVWSKNLWWNGEWWPGSQMLSRNKNYVLFARLLRRVCVCVSRGRREGENERNWKFSSRR